jgi:hypothetical protein
MTRKIHTSHTKLGLIDLIIQLNLPVMYNGINKLKVVNNLRDFLLYNKNVKITVPNNWKFKTYNDILSFLRNPSEKKVFVLTCRERQLLLTTARRIHGYVANGCIAERTFYKKEPEQLHIDALYVSLMGGDIPTCRRAIYKLNETLGPDDKYDMVVSPEVRHAINIKSLAKCSYTPCFSRKTGVFNITFD